MIVISDQVMTLTIGGNDTAIAVTAAFSLDAAADGKGAWIVSTHPARLFTRTQALTALSIAERLSMGFGDDDPQVVSWREELNV